MMSRRLLLNLALLAVATILSWLAYRQPGNEPAPQPRLTTLTAAQVTHVEIEPRGQPAVVLDRREGRWIMTSPYHADADPVRVGFVLDFLDARSATSFPVEDRDLPTYELDKPRATLTLNGQRFEFGGTNSLSMKRYIRSGRRVFLVFDTSYAYLAADAASFVSPRLFRDGVAIRSISVPGLKVDQDAGKLSSTATGVSADALARFVEAWRQARADSVHALDQEPKTGGEDIVIDAGDGPPLRLQILQRAPELVLARPDLDLAYHFPPAAAKQLLSLDAAGTAKP